MPSVESINPRRFIGGVRAMYVYCRTAEYPNGRWFSCKAGLAWAWRMR